ncbi:hypothetical protein [Priestia megaterium]|uniref:hypothetical protein n=1 Tax=Priestia megaterium TaxID=1404 RepID=UPI000CA0C740|nr:hypothetical protein [Priestia megaterium]AUO14769.1 hypothetical protein C0569_26135 [Priestia megaterium]
MKWTYDELEQQIRMIMRTNNLETLPSRQLLEGIGRSDVFNAIARKGGFRRVSERLNIPCASSTHSGRWTSKRIIEELKVIVEQQNLKEMPSKGDLKALGRSDLASAITKHQTMKYWADKLGLKLKESETFKGNEYEDKVKQIIEFMELEVKNMTTKHPYDLLVNDCVKIDVKVGTAHNHFGARAHTFALHKKYASCDIYVCVALNEQEEVENYFIIPARDVQIVTLNIGTESKYNKYKDSWALIPKLVSHFNKAFGVSG